MKSLTIIVLTTILCLFTACDLSAEINKDDFLREEGVSFSSEKREGIADAIYWKRDISHMLPFSFKTKKADESRSSIMINHFELYTNELAYINAFEISAEFNEIKPKYFQSDKKQRSVGIKADWSSDLFSATGFISAGSDADEMTDDVPLVMGVESESSIFDLGILGKANYVSNMNSFSDSSRLDFHIKSEYDLGDKWNSNLQLGLDVIGDSKDPYSSSVDTFRGIKENDYSVYSAAGDNLSILNANVKCYPFRNLKVAVNYYYYTQNDAKVSSYAPAYTLGDTRSSSRWSNRITNGNDTQLGSEINFSADIKSGSGIYSTLLAGWYNPGEAYEESSGDENVFEIRGEIVVSF